MSVAPGSLSRCRTCCAAEPAHVRQTPETAYPVDNVPPTNRTGGRQMNDTVTHSNPKSELTGSIGGLLSPCKARSSNGISVCLESRHVKSLRHDQSVPPSGGERISSFAAPAHHATFFARRDRSRSIHYTYERSTTLMAVDRDPRPCPAACPGYAKRHERLSDEERRRPDCSTPGSAWYCCTRKRSARYLPVRNRTADLRHVVCHKQVRSMAKP